MEWSDGNLTLDEAMLEARNLDFPEVRSDDDGYWFEGEEDNTIVAVQALIGNGITLDQFSKFARAYENLWSGE